MTLHDFEQLGLVPRLPAGHELPAALRRALEQTSLLPVALVAQVATADPAWLQLQFHQAVMVRFESTCPDQAMQAGQLTRLVKQRLEQLGYVFYRGGFYSPVVGPQLQLPL